MSIAQSLILPAFEEKYSLVEDFIPDVTSYDIDFLSHETDLKLLETQLFYIYSSANDPKQFYNFTKHYFPKLYHQFSICCNDKTINVNDKLDIMIFNLQKLLCFLLSATDKKLYNKKLLFKKIDWNNFQIGTLLSDLNEFTQHINEDIQKFFLGAKWELYLQILIVHPNLCNSLALNCIVFLITYLIFGRNVESIDYFNALETKSTISTLIGNFSRLHATNEIYLIQIYCLFINFGIEYHNKTYFMKLILKFYLANEKMDHATIKEAFNNFIIPDVFLGSISLD